MSGPLTDRVFGHDLHVHTTLSACCHEDTATPEAVVEHAARTGLHTLGLADHMWENPAAESSSWYRSQGLARLELSREAAASAPEGLRVLIGCETEYAGPGRVGISPEAAAELDFVLVPCTHFHMREFVEQPSEPTAEALARHMVRFFREAVELGLATAIAHPFLPAGFFELTDGAHECIPDGEFAELFGLAAERGVAVEVHFGHFPSIFSPGSSRRSYHDETFHRMLSLALAAGAKFTLGSDAHALGEMDRMPKVKPVLEGLGFTDGDFIPLVTRL